MVSKDEASISATSYQSKHAVWIAMLVLTLVCLAIQIPTTTALTPVQDSNHVLAPTLKSPSPSNNPLIKGEVFLSKLEANQSQGGARSHALISPALQQCLDAERVTPQGQPARSTWVTGLAFRYRGQNFVANPFHANNAALAGQILLARGPATTNFVLAQLGVITTAQVHHPLPGILHNDYCFRSGQGNQPNVNRVCNGWTTMYQNAAAYNNYLTQVVGIQNPQGQSHYHSEQALLAFLYQDSLLCAQNLQNPGCRLGQALMAVGNALNPCAIEAFTLDIISIPNSVCVGCERALHQGAFLSGYGHALDVACGRQGQNAINLRHLVFTSSVNLYNTFGHTSCLGLNHVSRIPLLTNDGIQHPYVGGVRTSDGVILHQVPNGNVVTGNGQTLQARCAAVLQGQCANAQ